MPNLFKDVRQDLVCAYGLPSRLVQPIWRVKRAPKRAYASFRRFSCAIAHHFWLIQIPTSKMQNLFVDIHQDLFYSYGWPSRLFQPIWRVKRAPKRAYASFRQFSCAIAHLFWVIRIPTSKMPNFFVDVRQYLVYAYGWPSLLVRPIWKDK